VPGGQSTQTTQREVDPGVIDLAVGHPGLDLLPLDLLRAAADHRLGRGDPSPLQYGFEQGDLRFRAELARFLSHHYEAAVPPDALFVSGGVSQALDLVCSLWARPGDLVLVEEPTYFLALRIFADHGLRVRGVATDDQGLAPEALRAALLRSGRKPALLYTVPTHQNPTGATLSEARRQEVLALCREHGVLVVADEVYHLLTYRRAPPPPLGAAAAGGGVLSLGSFSKILGPGLRLGWIQGPPDLLQRLSTCGFLDSGGGLGPFTSAIVRSVLESGAQQAHLERLRGTYAARAAVMAESFEKRLGDRARFVTPDGGFFFWVRFRGVEDTAVLLERARARGVTFAAGSRFSTRGGFRDRARFCFSYYGEAQIAEGIARLAAALS
jgi:DNA-binding transcriptional MocR family regulator